MLRMVLWSQRGSNLQLFWIISTMVRYRLSSFTVVSSKPDVFALNGQENNIP